MNVKKLLDSMTAASRANGTIPVGTMASGAPIAIPYLVVKGSASGPCLWINGQVHGNEINGIFAALDFANALDLRNLKGAVVVTATGNPLAFDARRKTAPPDDQDLDQSYPGRANGFTTERMAHALFAEASAAATTLVNMHTMSHHFEAKPYGVYKVHGSARVSEDELLTLMAPFHTSVACRMSVDPGQGELPGNIAGALDYQMLAVGIPAFMIELGAGSRADRNDIAQGIAGLDGMARRLGMLPALSVEPLPLRRVTRRTHVTFDHGGLFRACRTPGEVVRAGEPMGEVMSVWGEVLETMTLPYDCIIIGIRRDPVVHSGDRFGFVAQAWESISR